MVLLVTREALSGAERLKPIIKDTLKPLFDQAVSFFNEARTRGQVPDLDPTHMVISVVGAVGLYFTHHAVVGQVLQTDPLSPEQVEKRRMEVVRMLHALITPARTP